MFDTKICDFFNEAEHFFCILIIISRRVEWFSFCPFVRPISKTLVSFLSETTCQSFLKLYIKLHVSMLSLLMNFRFSCHQLPVYWILEYQNTQFPCTKFWSRSGTSHHGFLKLKINLHLTTPQCVVYSLPNISIGIISDSSSQFNLLIYKCIIS